MPLELPILSMLWCPLQCTLGGFEELQSMKAEKREMLGLPPLPEDSIQVIRNMRAASPPASASDLIEQQQKRGRREHKVGTGTSGRALLGSGLLLRMFPSRSPCSRPSLSRITSMPSTSGIHTKLMTPVRRKRKMMMTTAWRERPSPWNGMK